MGLSKEVSFGLAKLLKEKGFDEKCKSYYDINEELNNHIGHIGDVWRNSEIENGLPYHKEKYRTLCISAPTIAQVIDWLYEKHGIWIKVDVASKDFWHPSVINIKNGNFLVHPSFVSQKFIEKNGRIFNSPTEAYSEAILYTLKNLI